MMESQSACRITTDMEDGAWTCVVCSTTNTHADECCSECAHYGTIWVRLEPAKAGTEFSEIAKLVESVAVLSSQLAFCYTPSLLGRPHKLGLPSCARPMTDSELPKKTFGYVGLGRSWVLGRAAYPISAWQISRRTKTCFRLRRMTPRAFSKQTRSSKVHADKRSVSCYIFLSVTLRCVIYGPVERLVGPAAQASQADQDVN